MKELCYSIVLYVDRSRKYTFYLEIEFFCNEIQALFFVKVPKEGQDDVVAAAGVGAPRVPAQRGQPPQSIHPSEKKHLSVI